MPGHAHFIINPTPLREAARGRRLRVVFTSRYKAEGLTPKVPMLQSIERRLRTQRAEDDFDSPSPLLEFGIGR